MGTDISWCVERRTSGAWTLVDPTDDGEAAGCAFDERNYECFSLLTGLDFSARRIRPLVAVASLRGLPPDISTEARVELLKFSDDTAFGQSWLDVADLTAFDWDRIVKWTYFASPPRGMKVNEAVRSAVSDHALRHGRPPQGWGVAGWSREGFELTVPVACRSLAGSFLNVVARLSAVAGDDPTSVRCIFEFTR